VLTHILAHVACSYLKLLSVPSAHAVATLHPAVRTLFVVPHHGVTQGSLDNVKIVKQASLFSLMDGLEARESRNTRLVRVHIFAYISADDEDSSDDDEESIDAREPFVFRWHEEDPSEADYAFVGRMLSYAFRLRARGISVLDCDRWTANGSRDETDSDI
jgi:hypothetical protein